MRVALAVNYVLPDADANLEAIVRMTEEAAREGAELVLFPEAALTGLINNGDPEHDLPLGQPIPGPVTDSLAAVACRLGIYLAIGLLEREGHRLYDSAVLLTPEGGIVLRYRRRQPQWHGRDADPAVYRQGEEVAKCETPLGSFAFLICGDLFDDNIVARVRDLRPDWLLFPFARCFDDGSWDRQRWEREEQAAYVERVRLVRITTLMTNYLADSSLDGGSFGGALVVGGDGKVLASLRLGEVGILVADL